MRVVKWEVSFKNGACTKAQCVYMALGIIDSMPPGKKMLCGLENARLTGAEVQQLVEDERVIEISHGYATNVLRDFREDVLAEFFKTYPDAAFILDWRNLAKAVYRFTTRNTVGWTPDRAGVQDCIQKMRLLQSKHNGEVAVFNSATNRIVLRKNGNYVRNKEVKPYDRAEATDLRWQTYTGGETVFRLAGGGLAYNMSVPLGQLYEAA